MSKEGASEAGRAGATYAHRGAYGSVPGAGHCEPGGRRARARSYAAAPLPGPASRPRRARLGRGGGLLRGQLPQVVLGAARRGLPARQPRRPGGRCARGAAASAAPGLSVLPVPDTSICGGGDRVRGGREGRGLCTNTHKFDFRYEKAKARADTQEHEDRGVLAGLTGNGRRSTRRCTAALPRDARPPPSHVAALAQPQPSPPS